MIVCHWNERRAQVFLAVGEPQGEQPPLIAYRYVEPSPYPRATCPVYEMLAWLCQLMACELRECV